jgi:hypothetical protein
VAPKEQPLWTKVVGVASASPGIYFWDSGLIFEVWHRGLHAASPLILMLAMLASAPISAAAAYCDSRRWYFVTTLEAATFLLIGFRMLESTTPMAPYCS